MRSLSASQLLNIWENGLGQPPWKRALSLLALAFPDVTPDVLASLSLGQRDAYLLSLREILFGSKLVSLATCPSCAERLELTFDVDNVRVETVLPGPGTVEPQHVPDERLSISKNNCHATFRLPNSLDLARIAGNSNLEQAKLSLLDGCLISVEEKGETRQSKDLPEEVISAIVECMAAADPQADVQIALVCPSCAHQWQVAFDILSFLWIEIHAWAQRILREVHLLACAYGWREADIMALSPSRRQAYLQMIMG